MRKLGALEEGGSKEMKKKKKKNLFCKLKILFSSCYFFIIHFALPFKDDFFM
jgi:hypothetical protein